MKYLHSLKQLANGVGLCLHGQKFLLPNYPNVFSKRCYPVAPKKFYKNVTVAGTSQYYEINLDHKKLKTPNGKILQVPNYPLAIAIAHEWSSVNDKIMSCWMYLTGLAFTAADNPQNLSLEDTVEKALDFMETDTLLFRDESSEELFSLQRQEWDPILDWFNQKFDVSLEPCYGLSVTKISPEAKNILRKYLLSYDLWSATGILYGMETVRSVILCAATLERKITAEKAVQLTLLETEYQTSRWGSVEWSHDVEKYEIMSRFSAAILFTQLNSSSYVKKSKGMYCR